MGEEEMNRVFPSGDMCPTASVMSARSWSRLNLRSVPQVSTQNREEWDTFTLTEGWCTASERKDKRPRTEKETRCDKGESWKLQLKIVSKRRKRDRVEREQRLVVL
jgi:hypothetical protein